MTLSRRAHHCRPRADLYVKVYQLNTKEQSLIDTAINDYHNIGTSVPPTVKHDLFKKVHNAGNNWLTPANLNTYMKKRYKEFCATRSTYLSVPISSTASLQTTVEEEEKLFGHISAKTRWHLRWLYQVLNKEDHENLQRWARQPEYSVTMQEFKGYFAYLESSKVPVFQGLSKDARFRIQGLLRAFPSSDQEMFKQWTKQIDVDDIAGIAAYAKHLRNVMGLEQSIRGQSPNEDNSTYATSCTPTEVSAAESKTIPPLSPIPESTSVPPGLRGCESTIHAPQPVDTKHPSGPPRSRSPSPTPTDSSGETKIGVVQPIKAESNCTNIHIEDAPPGVTESKGNGGVPPASVEDPFRLLDNHPVRGDRNPGGGVRRHFRIVPVRGKGPRLRQLQSASRTECPPTDVEGTEYRGLAGLEPYKRSIRGANLITAPALPENVGSTTSTVHSGDGRTSPNTTNNYIPSQGEDDDDELLYPVDEESTDMSETTEIDELESDN